MPIFGNLLLTFSETNIISEISTFEIGYMQNFAKIKRSTLFAWPKMPTFKNLSSKFSKANVIFEISIFKIGYKQNFVERFRKLILLGPKYPNLGI